LLDTLPPAHFQRHPLPNLAPDEDPRGTALPQGVDNPTNVRRFDGRHIAREENSGATAHGVSIAKKVERLHEEGEQPGQHGAGDQRRPIPGIQAEETTTVCRNAHSHGTLLLFVGYCFRQSI
jgi:hypothetical protein